MISNSQTKLITSLKQKKYRQKHGLFVAEGPKVISELLAEGMELSALYAVDNDVENAILVSEKALKKISFLKTPNASLAVFRIPKPTALPSGGLIVALDAVRDPGNLGTIIRLCDWFGIEHLVCTPDTVDVYNPKVVQATMGSLARVAVHYCDLPTFFESVNLPIFGGFMDGKDVYSEILPSEAVLVVGNEANGITEAISEFVTNPISIPRFGKLQRTESLNVATATAILLSEFRRTTGK